jgi:hypothetical protein
MIAGKYPGPHAPTIVFANAEGSVSIAINHTENRITLEQIPGGLDTMVEGFKTLHPKAQWFRKEATKINGRNAIVFDLRTQAVDTEVRNVMLGTSLEDRFLIVTFNCTKALEGRWLATGKKVIDGVKVK